MIKRIAPALSLAILTVVLFCIAFAASVTDNANNISATGWTDASNASASDNAYATNAETNPLPLLAMDYVDFALTASDVVDSIRVRIDWFDDTGALTTVSMRLVKGASPVGTDNGAWSAIPSSETTEYFSGGLWGTTWSYTDINSNQFGFRFDVSGDGDPLNVNVDYCEITVYYHTATTGVGKRIIGSTRTLTPYIFR